MRRTGTKRGKSKGKGSERSVLKEVRGRVHVPRKIMSSHPG